MYPRLIRTLKIIGAFSRLISGKGPMQRKSAWMENLSIIKEPLLFRAIEEKLITIYAQKVAIREGVGENR